MFGLLQVLYFELLKYCKLVFEYQKYKKYLKANVYGFLFFIRVVLAKSFLGEDFFSKLSLSCYSDFERNLCSCHLYSNAHMDPKQLIFFLVIFLPKVPSKFKYYSAAWEIL
jgi:hypothetical protein